MTRFSIPEPPISLTAKALMLTSFVMTCRATLVYALIGPSDGRATMLHRMDGQASDTWSLSLRLLPGSYRYRYYAVCGSTMTYVPANEAEAPSVEMDGADAILAVVASISL